MPDRGQPVTGPPPDLPPLPRRGPSRFTGRAPVPAADEHPGYEDACSESTLLRIRQALEALA